MNLDELPILETREYRGDGWFPSLATLELALRRGILREWNFNGPNIIISKEQYDQIKELEKCPRPKAANPPPS